MKWANAMMVALGASWLLAVTAGPAAAAVPTVVSFTARLSDADGQPVNGQRRVVLSLHESPTPGGGSPVWTETHEGATFDDGLVYLALGDTVPLDGAVFDGRRLFLEVQIGDVVMSPRLAITSVPYAVRSAVAERAESVSPDAELDVASVTAGGDVVADRVIEGGLGGSRHQPASSCADLHGARPTLPSGVYWVKPGDAAPFLAYCDMVSDGGGWTLVWSNLRGGRGKPATEIQWQAAINTLPRTSGTLSTDLESFTVFTGLRWWTPLAPGSQIRYAWANDYGSPIDQAYRCSFSLTGATYVIAFSACTQLTGSVAPGLVVGHNGKPFSAYDRDNDTDTQNCATLYSNSPWWYTGCWNGSISGGGELTGSSYFNGAYWAGSAVAWGSNTGEGAGNGWLFVK
jgi:fibrinogen beta/gamma subunit family protein